MKRNHYAIQIGKCGLHLGHEYWKEMCTNLFIDPNGFNSNYKKKENDHLFFKEFSSGKMVPRAILFDLEPRFLKRLENGTFCNFYSNQNMIFDKQSASNNWANGYIKAEEYKENIEDVLRKNVEECDQMPYFEIFHSLSGGTGSGSGSYILEFIKNEFLGKFITSYSVIPDQKQISNTTLEPYNSILSIRWLTIYSDSVVLFENDSVEKIINVQNFGTKTHVSQVNSLIAKIAATINTSIYCSNIFKSNIEDIFLPLIPIPNIHFFTAGISEYFLKGNKSTISTKKTENRRFFLNHMIPISFEHGKLISSFHLSNGHIFKPNTYCNLKKNYANYGMKFIKWASPVIHYSYLTDFSNKKNLTKTEVHIINHSSIKNIFQKILTQYNHLRKRSAFLNNYLKKFDLHKGVELFRDAEENIFSLIEEYETIDKNFFI